MADEDTRERIVRAAAEILETDGLDGVSTRAVASRAGVPPPTIFRIFRDKEGLLEAVGEHGFERYLQEKATLLTGDDPVEVLRAAWDLHVEFGLAHPAYYTLVYGGVRSGYLPPAGERAVAGLHRMITQVAAAGRLRMSVERAAQVMHSAGVGTILTLISQTEDVRDLPAAREAREMVLATITDAGPAGTAGTAGSAMALRAAIEGGAEGGVEGGVELPLSAGERVLLLEWLNRMADA